MFCWSFGITPEANIQICARTEDLPSARQNDDLDALIHIEHGEELLKIPNHR